MTGFTLAVYVLKFMIPSVFTILFRAFGLWYRNRSRLVLGFGVYGHSSPSLDHGHGIWAIYTYCGTGNDRRCHGVVGRSYEAMFSEADAALYRANDGGRSRYCVWGETEK